jgi:hypothetical protein
VGCYRSGGSCQCGTPQRSSSLTARPPSVARSGHRHFHVAKQEGGGPGAAGRRRFHRQQGRGGDAGGGGHPARHHRHRFRWAMSRCCARVSRVWEVPQSPQGGGVLVSAVPSSLRATEQQLAGRSLGWPCQSFSCPALLVVLCPLLFLRSRSRPGPLPHPAARLRQAHRSGSAHSALCSLPHPLRLP